MTTLTLLYLIFAKNTSIKENKFITPAMMKKILHVRTLKNKVWNYVSKVCRKTFRA